MAFTVTIDGKSVQADCNVWTLVLYEMEFGSDMLKDFYGKTSIGESDENGLSIDFTKRNWTSIAKALWACVKTHDDYAGSFRAWSEKAAGIDLAEVHNTLFFQFLDTFFRDGAGTPEENAEEGQREEVR